MAGRFLPQEVEALLVACHRCCCVCHRFCGVKIEIDRITPGYERGENTIGNAIAVCFECHAEILMYNPQHPRGRRFQPSELRRHKEQWLQICARRGSASFRERALRPPVAGSIESLVNELEFNRAIIATIPTPNMNSGLPVTSPLRDRQFQRALARGALAVLRDEVKNAIFAAYAAIGGANQEHRRVAHDLDRSSLRTTPANEASRRAGPKIEEALAALVKHMTDDGVNA